MSLNFGQLAIQDKSLITLQNLSVLSVKLLTILRGRKDLWYEIHNYTDEQKLIKEIQEDIQQYILPFFDQLDSVEKILSALEKDSNLLGITFDLLIFYAEHGKTEKAQAVYNQLLQKVNPLAKPTLEGYAKKYGLKNEG